jgi:hypothetical protein
MRHFIVDVNPAGQWVVSADLKAMAKDKVKNATVPAPKVVHPCSLADVDWPHNLPYKCRFSTAFNRHFQQYNPAVVVVGDRAHLQSVENRVRSSRLSAPVLGCADAEHCEYCCTSLVKQGDQADVCVPMTFAELRDMIALCKAKQYTGAWDKLDALGTFNRYTTLPSLAKRGRPLKLDGRLSMIKDHWIGDLTMLVCVIFYVDCIKLSLSGGKRDVALTTSDNAATGGESTLDAAVRELKEETNIEAQTHELIKLPGLGSSSGMQFFKLRM